MYLHLPYALLSQMLIFYIYIKILYIYIYIIYIYGIDYDEHISLTNVFKIICMDLPVIMTLLCDLPVHLNLLLMYLICVYIYTYHILYLFI